MKKHILYDRDGQILHTGTAVNRRCFIEKLIRNKASLENANLHGVSLAHMDIRGGNFAGADFTNCDLTGAKADQANFRGALLRGIRANGLRAVHADFQGAHFAEQGKYQTSCLMNGSRFTYSDFSGALIENADFTESRLTSTLFVGATVKNSKFANCKLGNCDWTEATVTGNNFSHADMNSSLKIASQSQPNRTRNALVAGNRFEGTSFGVANGAFVRDNTYDKLTTATAWSSVSTAFFLGGHFFPMSNLLSSFGQTLGTGAGFIVTAGALSLMISKIEEAASSGLLDKLRQVDTAIRYGASQVVKRGKSLHEMQCVLASKQAAAFLTFLARSRDGGLVTKLGTFFRGQAEIILCDRESLSMAVTHLNNTLRDGPPLKKDIYIFRQPQSGGKPSRHSADGICIGSDGSVSAFWQSKGQSQMSMQWDKSGMLVSGAPSFMKDPNYSNVKSVLSSFQKQLIIDCNLEQVSTMSQEHNMRDGLDGSLVIMRRKDGRIDNPNGPALIDPTGEGTYYRNARKIKNSLPPKPELSSNGPSR
ncbi:pentapeptide repeat-containing protein [Pseudovibrio ascidiaceicola]|uniref:pentapeptide repeat-containing protein n=1 Tax=Pseudovibrio ascidiaceicola TaxID=285279 RepID=UPI003D35C95F